MAGTVIDFTLPVTPFPHSGTTYGMISGVRGFVMFYGTSLYRIESPVWARYYHVLALIVDHDAT